MRADLLSALLVAALALTPAASRALAIMPVQDDRAIAVAYGPGPEESACDSETRVT